MLPVWHLKYDKWFDQEDLKPAVFNSPNPNATGFWRNYLNEDWFFINDLVVFNIFWIYIKIEIFFCKGVIGSIFM